MKKRYFIGIDPGYKKVGIALVDQDKQIVYKSISKSSYFLDILHWLVEEYDVEDIIVGNGGNYRTIIGALNILKFSRNSQKRNLNIHKVDESSSSIEARKIFVEKEKNFIGRIICYLKSFFLPLDDYAAYVLVCRFLSNLPEDKRQPKNI
ncbi:MAG: Holliday junction resolvase RuvX [bacterium]